MRSFPRRRRGHHRRRRSQADPSVVEFGDKTVREVMTPRPDIVAIEMNRPLDELRELAIKEQYHVCRSTRERSTRCADSFMYAIVRVDEADRANRKVKELLREIRLIPRPRRSMICCGRCRQTVFTWPS